MKMLTEAEREVLTLMAPRNCARYGTEAELVTCRALVEQGRLTRSLLDSRTANYSINEWGLKALRIDDLIRTGKV